MKPYGGPGFQQVVESQSFYWDAQWWADQGYIVVTTDGRGTTGRGPQWDRAIYETMKSVTLEDRSTPCARCRKRWKRWLVRMRQPTFRNPISAASP